MALPTSPTRQEPRSRDGLLDHAKAVAVILEKEIGVPFTIYDASTGQPVRWIDEDGSSSWEVSIIDSAEVLRHAQEGQAQVIPGTLGCYEIVLVLFQGNKPLFVAGGEFNGLAKNKAETDRELAWLERWIRAVNDRLRLNDYFRAQKNALEEANNQAKQAWEGLLSIDHALRRVRLHKEPSKNEQKIVENLFALLDVQAIACIPPNPNWPVLFQGEELLSESDARQLGSMLAKSPHFVPGSPLYENQFQKQSWTRLFPNIQNALAMPINDDNAVGWILAFNKGRKASNPKKALTQFRKTDAALLTPFVGLLWTHANTYQRFLDLKELVVGMARSLTAAIDSKDKYTLGHSERVARIAVELGRHLSLEGDQLNDLYLAGLLHDIGKIGVPDEILAKVEPLTTEEFDRIKDHVVIGYKILEDLRSIHHLLPGVLYHHERWDGKGYPEGLAGDAIPLIARILAVADAYDAMSTDRPYRKALPFRLVEERLQQGSGTQWDKQVVDAFLKCKQKIHTLRQRVTNDGLRQVLQEGAMRTKGSTTAVR